jgi:glycosyltransferase involved in cell wall biosynthesis
VEVLQFEGYRSAARYLGAMLGVFRRTWSGRYDIVHAHFGLTGVAAIPRWRTPLVVTLHGSDALVGSFLPAMSRLACRFASAVVAVSDNIAARFPAEVIPCGIDLDRFRPMRRAQARAETGLPAEPRFVLFPFDPARKIKRHDLAVAALARLQERDASARLLGVHGVPYETMPSYYAAADALLLCSDSEGSPTCVKEAIACNLPVVSTPVGDVPRVLDGVPIAEIAAAEAGALAESLERVLRRGVPAAFDGRRAMEPYSSRKTAETLVRLYERVVSARLRSRGRSP